MRRLNGIVGRVARRAADALVRNDESANWLASELYARDVRRQADDERLAPMPHIYLYPEARALFPKLPAQAVSALVQDVLRKYRQMRSRVGDIAGH